MTKAQKQWMKAAQGMVRGATVEHLREMLAKDPQAQSRLTALAKDELTARGEKV